MALEGTLKDVGLSDIFQLLSMQKKTGILTVFRSKDVVTVSFEKGQVVFADEFQRSEQERLGSVLLKSKLITPKQLLETVDIQKQTLQKLGFIMVEKGYLSQEQLKQALQIQVRETVFKLFRWEDGQFKFTQEPIVFDESLYLPIPTDFIVMEGIRRIDEWPLIKKKVASLDIIFDRNEAAEEKISTSSEENTEEDLDDILSFVDDSALDRPPQEEKRGFQLSSSERVVFTLVNGQRTVQDLIDEGRIGEFETCKALYSLLSLSLIKKVAEMAPPKEEKPGRAVTQLLLKISYVLAAVLVISAVFLMNPLSPVRLWRSGQETMEEIGRISDDLRREKVKFALLCYFLDHKGYPSALGDLVDLNFIEQRDIHDHNGEEFSYLRETNGYSLGTAVGWNREDKKTQ